MQGAPDEAGCARFPLGGFNGPQRTSLSVRNGGTELSRADYTYDSAGRLWYVEAGGQRAEYGYTAGRVVSVAYSQGGGTRMTRTFDFDSGGRLESISQADGSSPISSHSYQYDSRNRRTRADRPDGSWWLYQYNDRSEVTSGMKRLASAYAPGHQFKYAYDGIGNRDYIRRGGLPSGATFVTEDYAAADSVNALTTKQNNLNQWITGQAAPAIAVKVNGTTAQRLGDFFYQNLQATNSSGPAVLGVDVTTILNTNNITLTATETGKIRVPPASETFSYDADGNLIADGLWLYTWDAENRLVAEIDASGNPLRTHVWGPDLSGTQQGAGGVGGLLFTTHHTPEGPKTYYPLYDGNGNIMGLRSPEGQQVADYEYGPFGEPVRATGTPAKTNPFRFSSKYTDEETGLVYYGYRYYNPTLGRWISRDPIGEAGGPN